MSKTRPATGNHEYLEQADHQTAVGHFTYFGSAAGDLDKGYYSYSIGSWHAFVLNTGDLGFGVADCFPVSCAQDSEQEQWLQTELDSLPPDACILAYWHHPRYSSETSVAHAEVSPLYDDLYDAGAELVLNGHSHTYERFAPMDAADTADATFGVREFVVGTGGKSHTNPREAAAGARHNALRGARAQALAGQLQLPLRGRGRQRAGLGQRQLPRSAPLEVAPGEPGGPARANRLLGEVEVVAQARLERVGGRALVVDHVLGEGGDQPDAAPPGQRRPRTRRPARSRPRSPAPGGGARGRSRPSAARRGAWRRSRPP